MKKVRILKNSAINTGIGMKHVAAGIVIEVTDYIAMCLISDEAAELVEEK